MAVSQQPPVQVGRALAEIRDNHLYKLRGYTSFEEIGARGQCRFRKYGADNPRSVTLKVRKGFLKRVRLDVKIPIFLVLRSPDHRGIPEVIRKWRLGANLRET